MIKIVTATILTFILVGCGSGSTYSKVDKKSKVHFGLLSNATIKIYELGEEKKLIFNETTSTGTTLEEIGNFDTSSISFDGAKFYQYEISGGENWDIDKDGKMDTISTQNSQVFRAVYKGKKSHVAWWGIKTKGVEKISEEL